MLRRYLIVNGVTTALAYSLCAAFVPSIPNILHSAVANFETFAMRSPILGPMVHGIVIVRDH